MYELIYDYENLYNAHLSARKGKRTEDEIVRFEMEGYANIAALSEELKTGRYRVRPYTEFKIYDPKERTIFAPAYRDRVVQHCLCDNIISPVMENRLIYDNAASRKGKGTHFALNRVSRFLSEYYRSYGNEGYILKCDISKYFDNINHRTVYEILNSTGKFDRKTLWLIKTILNSYHIKEGKGIPLGNQTSQWFALVYLDRMDRIVKEVLRIKYYSRYMDDCLLIHHDKEYLKHCLEVMRRHIEDERGLVFNSRTQIVPISQGADYLGFRFYLTDTGKVIRRLRGSSKKRIKRRLKKLKHMYAKDEIDMEAISRSLASYRGHLSHGHTYMLRRRILKDFVLKRGSNN